MYLAPTVLPDALSHVVSPTLIQPSNPAHASGSVTPPPMTPQTHVAHIPHQYTQHATWYPDFDVTNHLTNITLATDTIPSTVSGKVIVGNDFYLDVYGIGTFANNNSTRSLMLNNLLYAHQVTKKLVSVSQFSKDNHVYF